MGDFSATFPEMKAYIGAQFGLNCKNTKKRKTVHGFRGFSQKCYSCGFAIFDGSSWQQGLFSSTNIAFFGKTRKNVSFFALQMLIFLAGGFANPPGLTMWSKHAYGLTEPYSPLMISYININMMEMVIPNKLALKVGLYSTNTNNPSKPPPQRKPGLRGSGFLMLL